jgi:YVTN family beta-propeller protein
MLQSVSSRFAMVATVAAGLAGASLAATEDTSVVDSLSGTLVVGDVAEQRVIKHIPLGMTRVARPSTAGVFPHPDNVHAFVTVRNDNSVLVLNLETGATLARVEVRSSPDGVAWSPVQR